MDSRDKNIAHVSPTGNVIFLQSDESVYSYADLDLFTLGFKNILDKHTDDLNSPVAFLGNSSDILVLAIAACWKLGVAFVPLSPQLPKEQIKNYLSRIKPAILFTDEPFEMEYEELTSLNINILSPASLLAGNELNAATLSSHQPGANIDLNKTAGYFFTSGTSGKPKIVPIKRRQVYYAAKASASNFKPDSNKQWLLCLPLNHVGGITIILRSIIYGTGIYRLDNFDTTRVEKLLANNQNIQVASLVPTMLHRLLDNPSFNVHGHFKTILLGGAPSTKTLLQEAETREISYVLSYGMTETCAQIVANPNSFSGKQEIEPNKVGKIFSPNKIQIRNSANQALSFNQPGTIWLKGPQIFDGYFDAEDNAGTFDKNGWFYTGDFGYLNENNELYIESRRDDLIITGGENVNPIEIEEVLLAVQNIKEAAVIGVPDDEWGQRIIAFVTKNEPYSMSHDELKDILGKNLPGYKIPKQIISIDEMPKTELGKIKKKELLKYIK